MPSLGVHSLIDSEHPVEVKECLGSLISEFSTIFDPLSNILVLLQNVHIP